MPCAQDDTQSDVCDNRLFLRVVEDVAPYNFVTVHSTHAVRFEITIRFRTVEDAGPYKESDKSHVPPPPDLRSGKEKCRRFRDACINGNGGVFICKSVKPTGGGIG